MRLTQKAHIWIAKIRSIQGIEINQQQQKNDSMLKLGIFQY